MTTQAEERAEAERLAPRRLIGRDRAPTPSRRAWTVVAVRFAPVVLLLLGLTCWSAMMGSARGQFQQPSYGYGNQPSQVSPAQNFNGQNRPGPQPGYPANYNNTGQPAARVASSIPSLEPEQGSASEPEVAAEPWEMPAIVTKVAQGGWLMVPLAVCSLIVFALSIERLIALRRGRVIPRPFVRRFTECVEDGQLSFDEATELCDEFNCPVAEVFQAAVRRWGRPMFEIEQAVMDAGDRVAERLKRFLRVFHAISNVAPLIGLLGTVLGMIESFEMISTPGSAGGPETLASGISVALMTTAGGLSVAIPAYLAYMYFSSKSDSYLNEIDKLCQRVVDCISAEGLENNGASKSRKRRAA